MNNNSTGSDVAKWCPVCGHIMKKDGLSHLCENCGYVETLLPNVGVNVEPPSTPKQYGWICPKCGTVMGPYESVCYFCRPNSGFTWGVYDPAYGKSDYETYQMEKVGKDTV